MYSMKIEKVARDKDEIVVQTTGAIYHFKEVDSKGEIECHQRIGKKRLIGVIKLDCSLKRLTIEKQDDEACLLHRSDPPTEGLLTIRVNADSLLTMECNHNMKVNYTINLVPEYSALDKGHFILIDDAGGISAYTLGEERPNLSVGFFKNEWKCTVTLKPRQQILTSIFPPRPYDHEKAFNDRIVHHFSVNEPYPSPKEIRAWSKWGNILTLHATIWQGKLYKKYFKKSLSTYECYADASFARMKIIPRDPDELRRVITDAHNAGMRVIPYAHPIDYPGCPEEFMKEISAIMNDYEFDGLYYDGVSHEIMEAYNIMRETRKLLGARILYVHCPSPILGASYYDGYYIYCPFIDTYADYILRAEHKNKIDWSYLRYTVSGHNISNCIGFLCNYDYSPSLVQASMDQIFKAKVRLPYWTGWWVGGTHMLKERDPGDKIEEKLQKIMRKEYFPKLKMEAKRAR